MDDTGQTGLWRRRPGWRLSLAYAKPLTMVRDRETLGPADNEAATLIDAFSQQGILLSTEGPHHELIKFRPPLCFDKQNADTLIAALDIAL